MMLQYKIYPCLDQNHLMNPDKYINECINYHSKIDKRRPMFSPDGDLVYSPPICSKISLPCEPFKGGACSEQCPYSHNMFESEYHYYSFRIKICSNL